MGVGGTKGASEDARDAKEPIARTKRFKRRSLCLTAAGGWDEADHEGAFDQKERRESLIFNINTENNPIGICP